MSLVYHCSLSDVEFTISATAAQCVNHPQVWYGGAWLGFQAPLLVWLFDAATPGVYYVEPHDTECFWEGWSISREGSGTLVAPLEDTTTTTVRFRTDVDEAGAGRLKVYVDGTLVDTYQPATPAALQDLVSELWIDATGLSGTGQTVHVGTVTATVWRVDDGKVLVADDEPQIVASVKREWPAWVAYATAAGTDFLDYKAGGELYVRSDPQVAQVQVDDDGALYGESTTGPTVYAQRILLAEYVAGATLHLASHPVSQALLLTDCGLVAGSNVGLTKLQQGGSGLTWSQRYPLEATNTAQCAGTVCTGARTELVTGADPGLKFRPAASLDGAWREVAQDAWVGHAGRLGQAIAVENRYLIVFATGGTAYAMRVTQGEGYQAVDLNDLGVGATITIGASDYVCPAVAYDETQRRLVAALQHGADVEVYASSDQGASWTSTLTVADLGQPALWAAQGEMLLVGYRAGAYQGAGGRVVFQRLSYSGAALAAAVIVGPADDGRPAVCRRHGTWELIVLAVKTGSGWTGLSGEAVTAVGAAEYRSVDWGGTWVLKGVGGLG